MVTTAPTTGARTLYMPKSIAAWLVEQTTLTFDQIGEFCGLHPVTVKAIADGDINLPERNPIHDGYITQDDLDRCQADPEARLVTIGSTLPEPAIRAKGPRYVSVAKRADKPDGILWIIKTHPELKDSQIIKLIGTTKNTINAIRGRTHPNMTNLKPRHPVLLGLCRQDELNAAIRKSGGQVSVFDPDAAGSGDGDQPEVDFSNWG